MNEQANKIIDALGGTNKVAAIFGIGAPSVSDWRKYGIPRARMMYLEVAKKKKLKEIGVLWAYPQYIAMSME